MRDRKLKALSRGQFPRYLFPNNGKIVIDFEVAIMAEGFGKSNAKKINDFQKSYKRFELEGLDVATASKKINLQHTKELKEIVTQRGYPEIAEELDKAFKEHGHVNPINYLEGITRLADEGEKEIKRLGI